MRFAAKRSKGEWAESARVVWRPFAAMVAVQTVLLLRSPLTFAAGMLVSFGGVLALGLMVQMFAPAAEGGAPLEVWVMFYGYLLYVFLSDSLWRIGFSVRPEQVQGTFEALHLAPAPAFAGLLARVLPLFGLSACGALLALALASLIFGDLPVNNVGLALAVLAATLAGTLGLGLCFAAYTLLVGEAAAATGNLLEFGLLFFCAMLFPFRALPGPLLAISRLLPLSYSVDAFRSALLGFPPGYPELAPLATELWIVAVSGLASPILGYAFYRAVIIHLRRAGRLGQY
jgi:ABC-type polysaccharide/polyol phosphate export permease